MKRKIKVIHICDKFGVKGSSIHGVSRLFTWWFPRFDETVFDVKLVGLRGPEEARENLRRQGIDVINLGKGKLDPSTLSEIIELSNNQDTDILHLHGYGASNFGRIAAKITGAKAIIHEHFVDPAMPFYQTPADYLLSGLTDYGIAVSESVKDFMVKQRYIKDENIEVVFNGAPLDDFEPVDDDKVNEMKERWDIPAEYNVVGTVGRLDEQKGIEYFIGAAAKVLKKFEKVKFLIVGDGPLMDDLKEQSIQFGIGDHVIFTGYQSDIPPIQSMFDIQVFPSLWEGTPLTLFEAMSMERPIVSTTVDGLGEVLRHKENALLVPPKNVDQLSQSISNLLADRQLAERLGTQAHEDSHRFDIRNTVKKIQNIYIGILEGNMQ